MSFFGRQIDLERKTEGRYQDGVWVEGYTRHTCIKASTQPASRDDLQLLPEGRRVDGAYAVRSTEEIKQGDVFTIYGERHEVIARMVHQNGILPSYVGIATRENKQ